MTEWLSEGTGKNGYCNIVRTRNGMTFNPTNMFIGSRDAFSRTSVSSKIKGGWVGGGREGGGRVEIGWGREEGEVLLTRAFVREAMHFATFL